MKVNNWKKVVCGGTGALMIVLTGCESVGGLDVNKALVNQYAVKSAESQESLKFELLTGDLAGLPPEAQKLVGLFKEVTIKFTEEKIQDPRNASMKGEFTYGKGSIPFELSLQNEDIMIRIEGVSKPIYIRNAQTGQLNGGLLVPGQKSIQELQKVLEDKLPTLASFFIGHAPNPKTIGVTSVSEKVNNETVSLQKLHAEIKGSEALGLVKTFLQNIAADEKGLKEFLGTVFDVFGPIAKEAAAQAGEENKLLDAYLSNKTLAVETMYTAVQTGLKDVLASYDETTDKLVNGPGNEPIRDILSDRSSVNVDLYVDSSQQIRKSSAGITIPLPEAESGLKGIKLSVTGERWNINQPVTINPVKAEGDRFVFDAADPESVPSLGSFLKSVDKNSSIYKLLKEDLQITKRSFTLPLDDEDMSLFGFGGYRKGDVSMAPVTHVANMLDAKVKWDGETKQITVTDDLGGHTIVFTLGSAEALVDGKPVTLEQAVELHGDYTSVPLRFLAEALGGEAKWDSKQDAVIITRQ
ncbi:copper amine oxidase N-terminal domain-containing protein [Paenibacillus sp. RC84]|uniref:copper amine oxidase N-terminal domain-containing protein n=1 Tax=Paenibacillus sp. RC84 TaxID=3156252 RepID=UPI003516DE27